MASVAARCAAASLSHRTEPSVQLGRPGCPQRPAITQIVASVDALPALLGRGEFRDGVVPPGAGPLGVGPVHPAKGIALKADPR